MAAPVVDCSRCGGAVHITEPNTRMATHQLVEPHSPEWPAQALLLHAWVLCAHCSEALAWWIKDRPPADLREPF